VDAGEDQLRQAGGSADGAVVVGAGADAVAGLNGIGGEGGFSFGFLFGFQAFALGDYRGG
jgi:hypothetical protein